MNVLSPQDEFQERSKASVKSSVLVLNPVFKCKTPTRMESGTNTHETKPQQHTHSQTKESRHPSHTWGGEALTSRSHTGVKANTMDLYSGWITWSLQARRRCVTDFRISRHLKVDIWSNRSIKQYEKEEPNRPNLITRVHICKRPVNLCHFIREISAVFNPLGTTPASHFMQCCIIREREDRVMFTYSHLWWVQENWIHAESGIIDLDGCRATNIWGRSHSGTRNKRRMNFNLHQYFSANALKAFPDEAN